MCTARGSYTVPGVHNYVMYVYVIMECRCSAIEHFKVQVRQGLWVGFHAHSARYV